jgi:hypothetical protein
LIAKRDALHDHVEVDDSARIDVRQRVAFAAGLSIRQLKIVQVDAGWRVCCPFHRTLDVGRRHGDLQFARAIPDIGDDVVEPDVLKRDVPDLERVHAPRKTRIQACFLAP